MLTRRREQKTYVGKELLVLLAPILFKNNSHKNKKKPPQSQPKTKQTTTFKKKKKKGACYVCASMEHFAAKCPNRKGKDSANMVISEPGGTSGYGNLLPTVLSVFFHPNGGLTLVLIFLFVLMLLCFLLARMAGLPPC